ncbi:MAG: hypothetical protein ACR2RA_21690 [Geminicoccaceae bacterium]
MIKNLLLLGCACLVAAALTEAFLFVAPWYQAGEPVAELVFCEGEEPEQRPDERFGRTGVPNGVYFRRESEADGWNLRAYNEDGFRDLIDTGDENVLILGDSFFEGELVDNDRTVPYLLDSWNSDLAFRTYALGGWGTDDQHRVYRAVAGEIDHRLVVLGYYVGNDLADNLEAIASMKDEVEEAPADEGRSFLFEAHTWLRAHSRAYSFFYVKGRLAALELLGKTSLEDAPMPPEDVDKGIEVTERWLGDLAKTVSAGDADLLIVTLPSWNELIGIQGERRLAERQREAIGRTASAQDHVHVLDLKAMVEAEGHEQLYGQVDKHFNERGYFLVAKAIHGWINGDWRSNAVATPAMAPVGARPLQPDCAIVPDDVETFFSPKEATLERVSRLYR